jgi:hypothetical protein
VNPESPNSGASQTPVTAESHRPNLSGDLPSWVVLFTLAASATALAAAHLPPVFKKLGLFALAYGLLVGLIGVWLAQFAPAIRSQLRLGTIVVFLLALAGQVGIALESYRIYRSEQQRRELVDPQQALARRLLESATEPPDPRSQAALDEFRRSRGGADASFGGYLQFRVSNIGIQSRHLAWLFWSAELLLGGLAAGWVFRRAARVAINQRASGG